MSFSWHGDEAVELVEGTYGPRAIIHSAWSDELTTFMLDNKVVELELNHAKGWTGPSLDFLAHLPGLRAFEILDFGIPDVEPVHHLQRLRSLAITTYCKTGIDFSVFPRIEKCVLEWRPRCSSLFNCVTLTDLFVNHYKGKDTAPFGQLVNLESLGILNAPITDLVGLRPLQKLQELRLAGLRCLTSLSGLDEISSLETLNVDSCRRISAIDEVRTLRCLKKLFVNNCGPIESLRPLDGLNGLESVLFWESTNIVDGDLSPLLRQRKLATVAFQNRRHYSHRREEIEQLLKSNA